MSKNFLKSLILKLINPKKEETKTDCTQCKIIKPCHFQELFVTSKGDVYPCCRIWGREDLRIGHIEDKDLFQKLENYNGECSCDAYKLRKAQTGDVKSYKLLNLEMSLLCQAKCAMCCVKAPEWKGKYDYYDALTKIVEFSKPEEILVQGGEILIQKDSLNWIEQIKEKYPEIKFSIVSNGNVGLDLADRVEKIFDRITFSVVGFQNETYKTIMGLDLDKTKAFAQELDKRNIRIFLKYLVGPSNIHEAGLFLEWGASLNPEKIVFADSNVEGYINYNTFDDYWRKIFVRSASDLKSKIVENKGKIIDKNIKVGFDTQTLKLFDISDEFLKAHELRSAVFWNKD